ncbi:MAG: hypothetical protein IKV63_04025 [Clostridia bacterium]|nr:hypothetical protein [Clostridia bacterium]
MESKREGLIYTAITVISIILCLFLGSIMIRGKQMPATSQSETQYFSEVKIVEEKQIDIVITQEEIAQKLSAMLPQNFPQDSVKITISADGTIYTGMTVSRNDVETIAADRIGIKEKLMLRMLPEKFEMGIWYNAAFDEESGMLSFTVDGFNINGMHTANSIIPSEITHEIAQAVNKVLLDSGYYFTKIEITDGAILLRP